MRLKLHLLEGAASGVFHVHGAITVVGCAPTADLSLRALGDPAIAGHHCVLEIDGEQARVRDLASPSGIYLNGVRVSDAPLEGGDQLRIGDAEFCVELATGPELQETEDDFLDAPHPCARCRREISLATFAEGAVEEVRGAFFCPACALLADIARAGPIEPTWEEGVIARVAGYELQRAIGFGNSSTVFLARRCFSEVERAIKFLRQDRLRNESAVERFLREMRLLAGIEHPNIVSVCDAFQTGTHIGIVMEYIDGEDLGRRVARDGLLPVPQTIRYMRDAARALAYLSRERIVHRDLKPENILVERDDDRAKIVDFNLAKSFAEAGTRPITRIGQWLGTPYFMAPEQYDGMRTVDARADLYSLGATFYYCMQGEPPIPSGPCSFQEYRQKVKTWVPRPIPGIPAGLAGILARLLEKRPERRFATASELLAALERQAA